MNIESIEDLDDIKAFLVESYENLNQIERDIINLEKTSTTETLVRIYRNIHTIKGNCGFLPFAKLEAVAHAGENLIGCLSGGKLVVNVDIANALLETVDTIRHILKNIEARGNEGDGDYSQLINNLAELQNIQVHEETLPVLSSNERGLEKLTVSDSIRVDVGLLDQVMNLVGELVLARNQVIEFASNLEDTAFDVSCQRLDVITTELHQKLMKTRLQPISTIWLNFPRMVRDLAKACGKEVQVEMEGIHTELDRNMIEAIKDPLVHLVRNCIHHGIETPMVRTASGKPPQGYLFLRAGYENGKVNIEIGDDGKGINPEELKQKAQYLGLISAAQATAMNELEAVNLIFLSGFSTSPEVTNISGRGVGMNVVKNNIHKINGTIDVDTQLGQGTKFKIKMPLTLAIISTLIVVSGGNQYAIIQESIQDLVRLEKEQASDVIEILYDIPVLRLRGKILPLVYLNRELQLEEQTQFETIYIVVIAAEDYHFGLVLDAIDDTQDIVVKPLGKQLKNVTIFAGATILGDGKIALILDVISLAKRAGVASGLQKLLSSTIQPEEENIENILLFVGPSGARMGIPVSVAHRLEEFSSAAIAKVGNQYVVEYDDIILPLVSLCTVFSGTSYLPENDTIQVVVVNFNQQHSAGLVVDRILDIVEESITIKGAASRPGVLYLAVIQGQVTEILDVENVVKIANPFLFSMKG